jgi:hypothetical protein
MAYGDFLIEYVDTKVAPDGTVHLGCITYKPRAHGYGYEFWYDVEDNSNLEYVCVTPGYEVAFELILTALRNAKLGGCNVANLAASLSNTLIADYPDFFKDAGQYLEPLRDTTASTTF